MKPFKIEDRKNIEKQIADWKWADFISVTKQNSIYNFICFSHLINVKWNEQFSPFLCFYEPEKHALKSLTVRKQSTEIIYFEVKICPIWLWVEMTGKTVKTISFAIF